MPPPDDVLPPATTESSLLGPRLRPGDRWFGRFRLEALAGRGGMGVVWRAHDELLGETVALKFVPEPLAADPRTIADLRGETRRARPLAHPNLVRIHDFFADAGGAAVVMEFVAGPSLAGVLAERGVLDPEAILGWLPGLCAALDYAHQEAGLVHRDFKPGNVLLTPAGAAKLGDFGISCRLTESATRSTRLLAGGTLAYMSPQQAAGDEPTPADDLYALGAMLYELVTGRPPFTGGDIYQQIQRRPPLPPSRRRPRTAAPLPPHWDRVLLQCLAKDPRDRPRSAGEVAEALRAGVRTHGGRDSRLRRRVRWTAAAVAAAVLTVVAWRFGRAGEAAATAGPSVTAPAPTPTAVPPGTGGGLLLALDGDLADAEAQGWNASSEGIVPAVDRHGREGGAIGLHGRGWAELRPSAGWTWHWSEPTTVSLWARIDEGTGYVVGLMTERSDRSGWSIQGATESFGALLGGSLGQSASVRVGDAHTPTGWTHIALVSDGARMRLYLNGALAGTALLKGLDAGPFADGWLALGVHPQLGPHVFQGALDDLRFERRVLTSTEIAALAADAPRAPEGTSRFAASRINIDYSVDPDAAAEQEFGPGVRMADWDEVKAVASPDPVGFIRALGLNPMISYWVHRGGSRIWRDGRIYSMQAHLGSKPGYYLAHDEIGGHQISLGSWPTGTGQVLARLPDGAQALPWEDRVQWNNPGAPRGWAMGRNTFNHLASAHQGSFTVTGGDTWAALERRLQVPEAASLLLVEWTCNLAPNPWGLHFECTLEAGETEILRARAEGEGGGRDVLAFILRRGDGPEERWERAPTVGRSAVVTLRLGNGQAQLRVRPMGGGAVLLDERISLTGLSLSAIDRVRISAGTGSDQPARITDLRVRVE